MPDEPPQIDPWPFRTVIREERWSYWMKLRQIHTEKALAEAMRISEPALWRVRKGHSEPGTKFIRHAQLALGAGYDELFRHEVAA